ncbi:hypothetical protein DSUL_60260 [Desulfovibrionales bacterium]
MTKLASNEKPSGDFSYSTPCARQLHHQCLPLPTKRQPQISGTLADHLSLPAQRIVIDNGSNKTH